MMPTEYELAEADPERRRGLRREELILEVTEALVQAMNEVGVTQSQIADRMGRTRGHISQLLSGGRNLTLGSIAEMADALGCRVAVRISPCKKAAPERTTATRRAKRRRGP